MNYLLLFLVFSVLSPLKLFTHQIDFSPYLFISNKNDSVNAELGAFRVPLNRDKKDSDSISISFIRFKSLSSKPSAPIIYLAGGPGGSGIETAKGIRFSLFMKLREISDVIALDQRGTGMSDFIPKCPQKEIFEIYRPISKSEYLERTELNIKKCLEFWTQNNVELESYNTYENANDIEDLRIFLGEEKISLWGISYGSHLAFEYIRRFEKNIEKVVLASLEGPDETIKLPYNTEKFIMDLCERSESNYGLEPKYPGLYAIIKNVHDKLKEEPVFEYVKNQNGKTDMVGISNFELQLVISTFFLKNPVNSKKIPKLYMQMHNGDFSSVAREIYTLKKYYLNSLPERPMSFAMDMKSGISEKRTEIINEQVDKTILGSALSFLFFEWMKKDLISPLGKEFRIMNSNNVESLLLSGTLDGRTYMSSAYNTASKFHKGKHVVIENGGHDLFMQSPKISSIIYDFFNGKNINADRIKI